MIKAMIFRGLGLVFWVFLLAGAAPAAQRGEERPTEEGTRHYLDGQLTRYFSAEDVAAARSARSSIVALGAYGEFATHVPRGLLIRERTGWATRSAGETRPLPADVSREIDHILADPAFWRERAYNPEQLCTGGARLMTLRHAGRVRTSRQSCGPAGLVGRLAEIAVTGRIPALPPAPPPVSSRPPPIQPPDDRVYPAQDPAVSQAIWAKTEAAAMAWNRGDLDTFLAPYAEDVAIVWPTGVEYNKQAFRARTRAAQAWRGAPPRQMQVHSSIVRQLSPYAALQTYQLRFSGGGRDTQMWVTALWQNRRGTWEVTHEQPGAETVGHRR